MHLHTAAAPSCRLGGRRLSSSPGKVHIFVVSTASCPRLGLLVPLDASVHGSLTFKLSGPNPGYVFKEADLLGHNPGLKHLLWRSDPFISTPCSMPSFLRDYPRAFVIITTLAAPSPLSQLRFSTLS
jgi:hypothetical protein